MSYLVPDFHHLTPAAEIRTRLDLAQGLLQSLGLDGALIIYPVDLFYFTGTRQAGHLFLPAQGQALLMVRRDLSRAQAESPLTDVIGLASLRDLPALVAERLGRRPRVLGLELDILPVAVFRRYEDLWPEVEFVDIGGRIMDLRAVKSEFEIAWMKKAGDLARRVYRRIPALMKEGLTEIELAGLITAEAYAGGHQNQLRIRAFDQEMYTWHVISGESGEITSFIDASFAGYGLSPAFPAGASPKIIKKGEHVLIDFGICLHGYQVDLTRMFALGRPPALTLEAYEALRQIETAMMSRLYPGVTGEGLFHLAVATAEELGFGQAFLGRPGAKVRFVGHGLGLEINEPPILAPERRAPLVEGMTVALELKMVLAGLGAVGLENTVAIRAAGPEKLTTASEAFIQA